jgi:hypothetical protein
LSSSDRARSVEPWIRARRRMQVDEIDLESRAGADADDADAPALGELPQVGRHVRGADELEDDVEGPVVADLLRAIAWQLSAATRSRLASWRTVAVTRTPAMTPSWTAAMPTPPAAPWTSSRSPAVIAAWVKRASCAVVNTSGTPPAAVQSSSSGTAWPGARAPPRAPHGRPRRRRP